MSVKSRMITQNIGRLYHFSAKQALAMTWTVKAISKAAIQLAPPPVDINRQPTRVANSMSMKC